MAHTLSSLRSVAAEMVGAAGLAAAGMVQADGMGDVDAVCGPAIVAATGSTVAPRRGY
ncbi:hypothetical protein [Mycobacterium sp. shizuoka-1]|uniref:hypothetical protein n=1 Tax=Mycobacterium sp. shizuoka-1 TaxID=2039281 RepID=UPI000C05EA9D|nr:hypothetical protein [Mycobacterium sp. shizuoka-1]GAY17828.1 hypothetical protein MSZK_45540 [Mycobacterium sp. shizuoka-1]